MVNNHAKEVGVPSSPRACRGEVDWTFLLIVAITAFAIASLALFAPIPGKRGTTWEVQTLPVKDDEVMCYILTTPKGAVDLECIPYYYEVEETQDEQETRA